MTDRPIYQKPSWRRWRRRPPLNRRMGFLAGGTAVLAIVGAILGNGVVRSTPGTPADEPVVESGGDRPWLISALRALTGRAEPSTDEMEAASSVTRSTEFAPIELAPEDGLPLAVATPEGLAVGPTVPEAAVSEPVGEGPAESEPA